MCPLCVCVVGVVGVAYDVGGDGVYVVGGVAIDVVVVMYNDVGCVTTHGAVVFVGVDGCDGVVVAVCTVVVGIYVGVVCDVVVVVVVVVVVGVACDVAVGMCGLRWL